jgi:hypothetical protein
MIECLVHGFLSGPAIHKMESLLLFCRYMNSQRKPRTTSFYAAMSWKKLTDNNSLIYFVSRGYKNIRGPMYLLRVDVWFITFAVLS